jgi:hypothetical protein
MKFFQGFNLPKKALLFHEKLKNRVEIEKIGRQEKEGQNNEF